MNTWFSTTCKYVFDQFDNYSFIYKLFVFKFKLNNLKLKSHLIIKINVFNAIIFFFLFLLFINSCSKVSDIKIN